MASYIPDPDQVRLIAYTYLVGGYAKNGTVADMLAKDAAGSGAWARGLDARQAETLRAAVEHALTGAHEAVLFDITDQDGDPAGRQLIWDDRAAEADIVENLPDAGWFDGPVEDDGDDEDDDLAPDPALVRRVAACVKAHLGRRRTGKVAFADIEAAIDSDPQLAVELASLGDGTRELLLDYVQTEIG